MFGYVAKSETTCPNCGAKGWEEKTKDYECRKCGFHKVETKDGGTIDLTFCEGCGCTLSSPCNLHPAEKQKAVKL